MNPIIETYCQQCGEMLMKSNPVRLDDISPTPSNICSSGHENNIRDIQKLQWSTEVKSIITHICTEQEVKELKLNAQEFISKNLNSRLIKLGKPELISSKNLNLLKIDFKKKQSQLIKHETGGQKL